MNYDINVTPNWIAVVWQLVNTLFLVGLVALIFHLVFKLPKLLKRISVIESKVNNIEETLERIENNMSK